MLSAPRTVYINTNDACVRWTCCVSSFSLSLFTLDAYLVLSCAMMDWSILPLIIIFERGYIDDGARCSKNVAHIQDLNFLPKLSNHNLVYMWYTGLLRVQQIIAIFGFAASSTFDKATLSRFRLLFFRLFSFLYFVVTNNNSFFLIAATAYVRRARR